MSRVILVLLAAVLAATGCNPPPSAEDYAQTRGSRVDVFFNAPGTRPENLWEPDAEDVLIELIDQTQARLDFAVMGFGRQRVIDAVIRAYDRGVDVRFVGDAGHLYNSGYQQLDARQIPMVTGNQPHIMHDKFFIFDQRLVFTSTANITDTDLRHNSNNFVVLDSPDVAADFQDEFEQMWQGRFGHTKTEIDNGRVYELGDTTVEVWFSPNEDALGRMLEYIDNAESSLRFTIFAFTKDQVGSSFIRKHEYFQELNEAEGLTETGHPDDFHSVAGVIDQSQLHSNGQYHEAYRLLGAGIPMRMDGIDNSKQPGDYQAGGGRLHSKTMVIDADGEDPVVLTGSFNWSSSATVSNDEFLLVLRGGRIAQDYKEYFDYLWDTGRHIGNDYVGEDLEYGDVVINEVQWYGVNDRAPEGNDEFIELRNRTDREIDLSMWQIVNENDFVVGLPPGSVVGPDETFLILDHTVELYQDGVPQDDLGAYTNGDLVVNAFNDNRQSRLYLKDGALRLTLQDPRAQIMDRAGDGGPPFEGGPGPSMIRSMERNASPGDGTKAGNWHACSYDEGGINVNAWARDLICATPGEANSPE